jgi:23S rRNA (uracil1939-C5)-methyltransferase
MIIANPPRTGMAEEVTSELDRLQPVRVVYISCDPATLSRDLQRLRSFRLGAVQAFDLFPQTTHVETVAVLEPI